MVIELVDLKRNYISVKEEIDAALMRVLEEATFILGDEVAAFEKEFAAFHEAKHCIGVDSGTSALRLALEAVGVQEGDEVITTPNTFIATVLAVSSARAKPVFVDVHEQTGLIDEDLIEKAITKKTRAIIPVHLYGSPCNMEKIMEIARIYQLKVIEDACQAHGAKWAGKMVGTFGDAGCFSFYPGKNLGGYGDGGAIITNNKEIAEKIKLLRNYGQEQKYVHIIKGSNARLDSLQAAILRVKLKHLEKWNIMRANNATYYNTLLKGKKEITFFSKSERASAVYHLYVIQLEERERLMGFLKQQGINAGIHYPVPVHLQPAYSDLGYKEGSFPVAEKIAKEIISLPLFPELKQEEIEYICNAINIFIGEKKDQTR